MTCKKFRGSAAVPREGMVKADAAHMLGELARSPSPSCRKRLSKQKSKVERRKTSRHKSSEVLVLRFLLFGLLLFFVARYHVLGLYDLADLAHMLLLLRSSMTADVRPSAKPDYRRALAQVPPAPWPFVRALCGIVTPPSMLELVLALLLAVSSNSNPCLLVVCR